MSSTRYVHPCSLVVYNNNKQDGQACNLWKIQENRYQIRPLHPFPIKSKKKTGWQMDSDVQGEKHKLCTKVSAQDIKFTSGHSQVTVILFVI